MIASYYKQIRADCLQSDQDINFKNRSALVSCYGYTPYHLVNRSETVFVVFIAAHKIE